MSNDLESADVGGLGSGPEGGSVLRSADLAKALWAESRLEHLVAISSGERCVQLGVLTSESILQLARSIKRIVRRSEDIGIECMSRQNCL